MISWNHINEVPRNGHECLRIDTNLAVVEVVASQSRSGIQSGFFPHISRLYSDPFCCLQLDDEDARETDWSGAHIC